MAENDTKKRVNKEKNRLNRLLKSAGISEQRQKILLPVIRNVAWMAVKLEDVMEEVQEGSLLVEYDNGGGQTGLRENPLIRGYENLWKSYMLGMGKILDSLPDEKKKQQLEKENGKRQTVLELVREKHQNERIAGTKNQN